MSTPDVNERAQNQDHQDFLDDVNESLLASTDENSDQAVSHAGTPRTYHVAGLGPVSQSTGDNGVVTTTFPERQGKVAWIKYDPNNETEPYSVRFRDGMYDADVEKSIKEGKFAMRVFLEPGGDPGDPDSIDLYDPYFNQVGELEERGDERYLYPNGKLSDKVEKENETGGTPESEFFKGVKTPFEHGGEKGNLYIDQKTGYVQGIEFSHGKREGQKLRFDRDENGNVTAVELRNAAGQSGKIARDGEGWVAVPPETLEALGLPGSSAGRVKGVIKVKDNGDIIHDAGDGTSTAVRIDGSREHFDFNEYSRTREGADGTKSKEYWDGYRWRQGEAKQNADGTTSVNFAPEQGKPVQVIRDARPAADGSRSNKFKVVFSGGRSYDADWGSQKMTYSSQQQSVDLYNSGMTNSEGKAVWMQGARVGQAGDATVIELKPGTEHQSEKIATGKSPYRVAIHKDGDVTAIYKEGPQVRSDGRGNVEHIVHANGHEADLIRNANGDVVAVRGSDGRNLVRQRSASTAGGGSITESWRLREGDTDLGSLPGRLETGEAGRLSIQDTAGNSLDMEGNGRVVQKRGGKIVAVTDANRQHWSLEQREGSDKPRWTVSSAGDTRTFEGTLKLYDNGLAAVETSPGVFQTRNPDASTSTYNTAGVELSRDFDDGAAIKRDQDGFVTELKDSKGNVKQFIFKKGPEGQQVIDRIMLNGKPFEVLVNGRLRELKPGALPNSTRQADLGGYVDYDPATGRRTVRQSSDRQAKARREEGLHGEVDVYDDSGNKVSSTGSQSREDNQIPRDFGTRQSRYRSELEAEPYLAVHALPEDMEPFPFALA